MPTNPIIGSSAAYTGIPTERKYKPQLDQEDFLKLLVAQIQNQDPLNPKNDMEMISQMAQFSLLDQIKELSRTVVSSQAFQLIGKMVHAEVSLPGNDNVIPVLGRVDRVSLRNGQAILSVGDQEFTLSDIQEVFETNE